MKNDTAGAHSPTRQGTTPRTRREGAELRELLDHLGRLLAREYLALLKEAPRAEVEPKSEGQE
jgi:hypothetical protein